MAEASSNGDPYEPKNILVTGGAGELVGWL